MGLELLFIGLVIVLSFGMPLVIVVFAVRMMRSQPGVPLTAVVAPAEGMATARCAQCNAVYSADYDACPHCARQMSAEGSLDVTSWGNGRVWSLLVASLWPMLYIFLFLGFVFSFVAIGEAGGLEPPGWFFGVFGAHAITILLGFALMGIYLFIAIRSPITSNAKLLWAAALFFGGMIAFLPAFYFLVWEPRARAKRSLAPSGTVTAL